MERGRVFVKIWNGIPTYDKQYGNGTVNPHPEKMPEDTTILIISTYAKVTKLPLQLPNGLKKLVCNNLGLEELPQLPEGLEVLECNSNSLTSLELPRNLIELNCNYNKLTSLELPSQLKKLDCGSNPLIRIPELPDSLEELACVGDTTKEKKLPTLPPMLRSLACNHMGLEVLPELPESLITLKCHNNLLRVLPRLPKGLRSISLYNNPWEEPFATYIENNGNNVKGLIADVNKLKNSHNNLNAYNQTLGSEIYDHETGEGFYALPEEIDRKIKGYLTVYTKPEPPRPRFYPGPKTKKRMRKSRRNKNKKRKSRSSA
jgi:hypothetical protein